MVSAMTQEATGQNDRVIHEDVSRMNTYNQYPGLP